MKLLVTGSEGQVGSELVRQALHEGIEVVSASKASLDISNSSQVEIKFKEWRPDIIINAAAYTAVDLAEEEADLAYLVISKGVCNLAEIAFSLDIPIIHLSTDYVFDGLKGSPYKEEDETSPLNVYGASKLHGEVCLRASGVKHVILRTSWVFGFSGSNFPRAVLEKAIRKEELSIISDQVGGPTFAGDIAKAILNIVRQIIERQSVAWGTYHFAGLPHVSWWDFASYVFDVAVEKELLTKIPTLSRISTAEFNAKAERPLNSRLDCLRIESEFGILPSRWREGVDELLNHIKKNREQNV